MLSKELLTGYCANSEYSSVTQSMLMVAVVHTDPRYRPLRGLSYYLPYAAALSGSPQLGSGVLLFVARKNSGGVERRKAPRLRGDAPQRHGAARRILIALQADVVDAHFAGLNAIHYLPKTFVFDLQCIAD